MKTIYSFSLSLSYEPPTKIPIGIGVYDDIWLGHTGHCHRRSSPVLFGYLLSFIIVVNNNNRLLQFRNSKCSLPGRNKLHNINGRLNRLPYKHNPNQPNVLIRQDNLFSKHPNPAQQHPDSDSTLFIIMKPRSKVFCFCGNIISGARTAPPRTLHINRNGGRNSSFSSFLSYFI